MNRSLFPEGVEIHQIDLVRQTQDTNDAIVSRFTNTSQMGVYAGLGVSPVAGSDKISIANGSGYTHNGQLIIVDVAQNNVTLADSTNGAINYVCAVYTEIYGAPQAHEDLGTTLPTAAYGSFRIAVLTAAQYFALPASDSNLNNNARDRALLLAIVTARGAGVQLSQGDIQSPPAYPVVYNISQPVNISGVMCLGVSPNTQVGTGTLTFTIGTSKKLTWLAPGATNSIASADITGDATLTLVSYDGSASYALTVKVTYIDLPVAPTTITDSIIISSIYYQEVPRLTSMDDAHRHMLGSGVPSINNPHGTTLEDIGVDIGGVLQRHQLEEHANGILNNGLAPAQRTVLQPIIIGATGVDDVVRVGAFSTSDVCYINGIRITSINGSRDVAFSDVAADFIELYGVYFQPNGTLNKVKRLQLNPPPGTGEVGVPPGIDPFGGNIQPIDVSDYSNVFDAGGLFSIATQTIGGVVHIGLIGPDPLITPVYVSWNTIDPSTRRLKLPYITKPVSGAYDYVEIWSPSGYVPGSGVSVQMQMYERPSSLSTYLVCYVMSQGKPAGVGTTLLGYGTYGSSGTVRTYHLVDRRLFGTTSHYNINEESISFNQIKSISYAQVVNGLNYVPYPYYDNVGAFQNPVPYALSKDSPLVTDANSYVRHSLHAVYADSAGSSSGVAWSSISGRPLALANMTGGNQFNDAITFAAATTFSATVTVNTDMVFQSAKQVSWIGSPAGSYFAWEAPGLWRMKGGNLSIPDGTMISAGVSCLGQAEFHSNLISGVRTPLSDYEAANKKYVDDVARVIEPYVVTVSGWISPGSGYVVDSGVLLGRHAWSGYVWSNSPSANECTLHWNNTDYNLVSVVAIGGQTSTGYYSYGWNTVDFAGQTGSIRLGCFWGNGNIATNIPMFFIMTLARLF